MRIALVAVVACAHVRAPVAPPTAGVSIAVYDSVAIVDDRRWIDVAPHEPLVLHDIVPIGELASLVVEPLTGALSVSTCTRDRLPVAAPNGAITLVADTVRCAVAGPPGRYLVRIAYGTPALHARVSHDLALAAQDRATLATTIAIATPRAIAARAAAVVVYDGTPGGDHRPRELARGEIVLDGSVAVLAVPPREVAAALVRIAPPSRAESARVWTTLVLPHLALAPGVVRVHAEGRTVAVLDLARGGDASALRLPLWADDALRVRARPLPDGDDEVTVEIAVANTGDVAREVWIEQRAPRAHHRRIERATPAPPSARGDVLRTRLVVAPSATEHARYTLVTAE